jgi:hypothetical protein
VETSRRQAEVASSAEPDSQQEIAASAEDVAAAAPESAGEAAGAESQPLLDFEPPVAEPAVGWVSQSSEISGRSSPPLEDLEPSAPADGFEEPSGIQFHEPPSYDDEVQPLDGLVGRDVDVPDEIPSDFRVETSEDIILRSSGGSEFQVPDASLELFAGNSRGERAPFEEDTPLPPPVEETASAPSEPEPSAVPEPEPLPEVVGWGGQPEEPVAEPLLEPAMEAGVPEAVLAVPEPEPGPAVAPDRAAPEPEPVAAAMRAYGASQTGGRPVAHFLKDILSSHPPAQAAPPAVRQAAPSGGGAPTRPAADALSLSSVFGEEEAPSTPPAVPAAGTGTGVSFDDFFGAPGATPTQRGTRAPDPKNDDLDQFHAWLQNLKR